MFTIVAYDTPSNQRRRRLARRISDFVTRVQKSVFEGHLPPDKLHELSKRIGAVIDPTADSVRVYQLPLDSIPHVLVFGQPPLNLPREYYWVGPGEPAPAAPQPPTDGGRQ